MFRTEVTIPETNLRLNLPDKVVTIGSCFAEVIGTKLQQYKADALVNPFGTIFNPISVSKLLQAIAGQSFNIADSLVQRDGIWYSYDLHSSLSSANKDALIQLIEDRIVQTRIHLQNAKLVIITLGTAASYKLADSGTIVANCHKLPARQFTRELLTIDAITDNIAQAIQSLRQMNPELQFIITVSPVRHVKETLQVNSVSKSILRVASHYLSSQMPSVFYFPAYEIMLDDLRDYRFYSSDMLHPTQVAEDYIWQKFVTTYLHPTYQQFIPEWDKMQRAIAHRPFHPQAEAHQTFLRNTIEQLRQLSTNYKVTADTEIKALEQQLI